MIVELRDRFGNLCVLDEDGQAKMDASDYFTVCFNDIVTDQKLDVCFYWQTDTQNSFNLMLFFLFESPGLYHALVSYKGTVLKNGDFNIVCLTEQEAETVQKCTSLNHSKNCYFNAKMLPSSARNHYSNEEHSKLAKPKSVTCYISSKQLTVKEYILRIIPKRLVTFRVSPSTKFYFSRRYMLNRTPTRVLYASTSVASELDKLEPLDNSDQLLIIDDGSQSPVELNCPERNIIVAVFTHFLLNKIGGSETFHDKQNFFFSEVLRYHRKHSIPTDKNYLKISRENILDSSMKATKSLSVGHWCKKFEIEFIGEIGIDWGGLRREWYELVCRALFDPAYAQFNSGLEEHVPLFTRFQNDKQGLIHPNPKVAKNRLAYYEFAGKIIGKALIDSAFGYSCKCLVSARFSRSFLAQLIGLRVNYHYFEHDDPDLYVSKIKFILENDVTSLDLYFVEEQYDSNTGELLGTIDLIPNGSSIKVNEANKRKYLDALAQYRLTNCVKDQLEAVLKGLNELVPDNLLSIFDENELELLFCGAANYSVSDLRMNHIVTGATYDFQKVVSWFWQSLANFQDEEFARLLQFTTGCSHLPPGGFSELNPRFQITSSLTHGTLPTAHTCFNQICLPDYDSFADFDRSLRIAITEGSEGFGLV